MATRLRIQLYLDPHDPLESAIHAALAGLPARRRAAVAKALLAQAISGGVGRGRRRASSLQAPTPQITPKTKWNPSPSRREIPPVSTSQSPPIPAWASAPAQAADTENPPEPQQTQGIDGASVARRALGQFSKMVSETGS